MTETAKQGTDQATAAKAASEPAAEPAATQPETKPASATGPAGQDAAATEPGETEPGTQDLDETKRKFRAALERKNQAQGDSQGRGGRDGSKINGAHGPAAARRNFRRKSG